MSKLQGIILILAAFGTISIVLSQTGYDSWLSKGNTGPVANIHINSHHTQNTKTLKNSQAVEDNFQRADSEGDKLSIVNNIYQSGSGSFYFYHENTPSADSDSTPIHSDDIPQQQYQASQLVSTQADIKVTGPIARTRLTQVFKNPSAITLSGIYVFPLPQDAAVDHLVMTIGNRKIEGVIKAKSIAKKMYVEAKLSGKKASLVSQIRPNMFTNHIANIPPHSSITVTIEYQQFIQQEQDNYSLRLPLSITPRYSANTEESVTQTNNIEVLGETKINVLLNAGLPLSSITSEHHPIKTSNPYSTEYQIALNTNTPANKDFVLNWQMKPSQQIQASHFTYDNNNYQYGLISLMPPEIQKVQVKRNVVFILDVSGSMVGEAIMQAKQALALGIQDLKDSDYFNVITFSSSASSLWHKSERASQAYKDEALQHLFEIDANGGTEINKALKLAFAQDIIQSTEDKVLNQIVFITDGSVNNENELMQTIYHGLGEYRLFTVGIGSAPNAYFMNEAATAGKGTYTFIGDIAHVKTKMDALLNKLKRPSLTNIHLNIKDANEAFGFEIYPSILPDLYADTPLIITYRRKLANSKGAIDTTIPFTLEGKYLAETANGQVQERKWTSQLPSVNAKQEHGIHKYWARMKIRSLNQQLNMKDVYSEGYDTLKSNIELGITELALAHNLVSQFTSLIAIDYLLDSEQPKALNNDELKLASENTKQKALRSGQAKMHQKVTAQYQHATLPRTATPAGIMTFVGMLLLVLGALVFNKTRNHHV